MLQPYIRNLTAANGAFRASVGQSFPRFYVVFIYCWTCSHLENSWNTDRWTL